MREIAAIIFAFMYIVAPVLSATAQVDRSNVQEIVTGNQILDQFLAALVSEDEQIVSEHFHSVQSYGSEERIADAAALIERTSECEFISVNSEGQSGDLFRVEWLCDNNRYFQFMDPKSYAPKVIMGTLRNPEVIYTQLPPPPPSVRSVKESATPSAGSSKNDINE